MVKTPACTSVRRLDAKRNPEPVNAKFNINADADQVQTQSQVKLLVNQVEGLA